MTLAQFRAVKAGTVVVLAALMSLAVIQENYILALTAVAIAILLLSGLKRQVKEVMEDERDYEAADKAARVALTAFSVIACLAAFLLLYFRKLNPLYEAIGVVLAYSVCVLLIFYSLMFKYYESGIPRGHSAVFFRLPSCVRTFIPPPSELGAWLQTSS